MRFAIGFGRGGGGEGMGLKEGGEGRLIGDG